VCARRGEKGAARKPQASGASSAAARAAQCNAQQYMSLTCTGRLRMPRRRPWDSTRRHPEHEGTYRRKNERAAEVRTQSRAHGVSVGGAGLPWRRSACRSRTGTYLRRWDRFFGWPCLSRPLPEQPRHSGNSALRNLTSASQPRLQPGSAAVAASTLLLTAASASTVASSSSN
jgi:hypothetical protein